MLHHLKTFVEHQYFIRDDAGEFVRTEEGVSQPIDKQVATWINDTQSEIVHPGQLSVHTSWYGTKENPFMKRCITLGLAVLYKRGNDDGQSSGSTDATDDECSDPVPFNEPD